MNPITVGRNIAKYRKAKNLTQAMLADLLGVSSKAVSKWECGRGLPDKSIFPAIYATLDITQEQLLEDQSADEKSIAEGIALVKKRNTQMIGLSVSLAVVLVGIIVAIIVTSMISSAHSRFTLTLMGAEFADGSTTAVLVENETLSDIKLDESKNFLGWADENNKFYTTENFLMPTTDTTLFAIYKETLGSMFTPSCLLEEVVTGARKTLAHEYVGSIRATRFEFEDSVTADVGYKILNGLVTRPDTCDNSCRVYDDRGNILFLTLRNNQSADIDITYEIEYHKILGQQRIVVPANGTITVPVNYSASANGNSVVTCFHKIIFNKNVSKVSLTVYGQVYNPDYYVQEKNYIVNFSGATYNGLSEFEMMYNSRLDENAELVLTDSDKTFAGWKTSRGLVYLSDAELLSDFRMTYGDVVITAIYSEDMALFTPSCVYGDNSKRGESIKLKGTHCDDGSTAYLLDATVAEWLIYNGPDEQHDVEGGCPVSANEEYLYFMTLSSSTDYDVVLELGPEYYGMRDHTTVTVPANETVSVALRLYGFNTKSSFWQINNKFPSEESTSDISLTIKGHYK